MTIAKSLITPRVIRYALASMLMLLLMFAVFAAISRSKRRPIIESQGNLPPISPGLSARKSSSNNPKLCFVRGDWIYLVDLVTGKETKLVEGKWPALSPTGDEVAFMSGKYYDGPLSNSIPPQQGRVDPWRIQVLDLRTKKSRDFSTLVHVRAFLPRWSNDGSRIAFKVINADETRLDIGVLDPSTGGWQKITSALDFGNPAAAIDLDGWVPGDQSILFHTHEDLYEVRIDGTLIQKIPVTDFCLEGEISSGTRFSFSGDRKYLLFDRIIDPQDMPISLFNLETKKLLRITPQSVPGTTPAWLPSGSEVLFTCFKRFAQPARPGICKISLDGTNLTTLVPDGDYPSFSPK
jgi:Tol biopolymer transport system component